MEVKRFERFETSLTAKVSGNPFDTDFYAMVTMPDGTKQKVNGFYDGDDAFKLRVMPEKIGRYTYETVSSVSELNGKTGEFTCVEARDGVHGKVKVKDKYWFEYEDGTPYLEVGTTCYAWIYQSDELIQKTLDTLSKGYFNKIRMCVFPKWYEHNRHEPSMYPFEGTLKNFDYTRPNVKLFRHLEGLVDKLADMGIEADIIIFHPYDKAEWGFSEMTKAQDRAYMKYLTARLSSFRNVWWSLANEYDLMRKGYKKKYNEWKGIAKCIHDNDPYGHLIGIHQCFNMFDHRYKYITHCSVQKEDLYKTVEYTDEYREKYGKPVVWDECSYEGNINLTWGNVTAQEFVRRFWEATARGGYMGHGETYVDNENDILWWSHGGELHGESQERIKFYKDVMSECKNLELTYGSSGSDIAEGYAGLDTFLTYTGLYQPTTVSMALPKITTYKVYAIDTWNMEKTLVSDSASGTITVELPGRPYMAVLAIANADGVIDPTKTQFDADTAFRSAIYYKGGKKFLKALKLLMTVAGLKKMYPMAIRMSINQGAVLGGMSPDKTKAMEKGASIIINDGKLFKGIKYIIKGMKGAY